jgi:hypothetical protein
MPASQGQDTTACPSSRRCLDSEGRELASCKRKLHCFRWSTGSLTLKAVVLLAFFGASGAFIGGQYSNGLVKLGAPRSSSSYISPSAQLMLQRNGATPYKCGCIGWGKGRGQEWVHTRRAIISLCSSKQGSEVGDAVEADSQFFPPYTDKILGRPSRSKTKSEGSGNSTR